MEKPGGPPPPEVPRVEAPRPAAPQPAQTEAPRTGGKVIDFLQRLKERAVTTFVGPNTPGLETSTALPATLTAEKPYVETPDGFKISTINSDRKREQPNAEAQEIALAASRALAPLEDSIAVRKLASQAGLTPVEAAQVVKTRSTEGLSEEKAQRLDVQRFLTERQNPWQTTEINVNDRNPGEKVLEIKQNRTKDNAQQERFRTMSIIPTDPNTLLRMTLSNMDDNNRWSDLYILAKKNNGEQLAPLMTLRELQWQSGSEHSGSVGAYLDSQGFTDSAQYYIMKRPDLSRDDLGY